ncbi:MAG: hypothetical protein A2787_08665 [Omnitrophica WOR_2 bacterium RIFCSPHIGHO2_01_FULL_48_9]|nr:MAG: hypothetical protein A2787_08665 [Omnitrophica WOR_2 bacterium RIFCSPHIGHO2_01_FULL_48_9]
MFFIEFYKVRFIMVLMKPPPKFIPALFLVILGLAVYANILRAPFQFDDFNFIVGNPLIKDASRLLAHWEEQAIDKRKILTFLTFALNYQWGKEDPLGYHLGNVILHISAAILLYYVLRQLFSLPALKSSVWKKDQDLFAFGAALLFLVHPLQTQSVTYVWQRSEVLSALFYLLSYYFYLRGRSQGDKRWFAGAVVIFYVGFFAKGTILSLPLLIVLTELSFLNLPQKKVSQLAGTLLAAGAAYFLLWYSGILARIFQMLQLSFLLRDTAPHFYGQYFLTQFKAIALYLRLCFVPLGQNLDYDFPLSNSLWEWPTFSAFLLVAGVMGVAAYFFKKEKLLAFGIFWFFICLFPTSSGFVPLEPVQEHRLYLPVAGFAIFLTAALLKWVRPAKSCPVVLTGIIVILSVLTVSRNFVWTSREALMQDTIRKSPDHPRPYFVLGSIYYQAERFQDAIPLYLKAIELNPFYPDPHNNLGLIYIKQREYKKAEEEFKMAMSVDPSFVHAYINLGYSASLQRKTKEAEGYFLKSLELKENHPSAFMPGVDKAAVMLSAIYLEHNRLVEAESVLNKALDFNPDNERAYFGLGTVYLLENDYPAALQMYKKVVEINPALFDGHLQTGVTYYFMKDYRKAIEFYEQALQVDPSRSAEVYPKLADAYRGLGDQEKADYYNKQLR